MQIYANNMQCGQMSIQQLRLHHKQQVKVKIRTHLLDMIYSKMLNQFVVSTINLHKLSKLIEMVMGSNSIKSLVTCLKSVEIPIDFQYQWPIM